MLEIVLRVAHGVCEGFAQECLAHQKALLLALNIQIPRVAQHAREAGESLPHMKRFQSKSAVFEPKP
jgi:hypothetical protein